MIRKNIRVFHFFILLFLASCSTDKPENKTAEKKATASNPPVITLLENLPDSSKPVVIEINKKPKPLVVVIPEKTGGSYTVESKSGKKTFKLLPPEVKPASAAAANFTTYNTEQGLAQSSIACGFRDKGGNLWFGTYGGGVSRYDGKSFTTFTTAEGLAQNNIYGIGEDKSGNIWFGTDGNGVSKYDGRSFTTYTPPGLSDNPVYCIAADKNGDPWFGTLGGGAFKYDGKTFTSFDTTKGLASVEIICMATDSNGNLWFGTSGGGISRYDGKTFTNFSTKQGLAGTSVYGIGQDKSGNLWFGTNNGVSRYDARLNDSPNSHRDGQGKSFTNFTAKQGLGNDHIRCVASDKNGNLWFGSAENGVSRYDGRSFTNYTTEQGLAHNSVLNITEDKSGNIWFGTYGGGLSRYEGESLSAFSTAQGLPYSTISSITEDKKGNLWFGTIGGGISRYGARANDSALGKSFTNFAAAQGFPYTTLTSILEDHEGNIWFGTNGGGAVRYDGRSFTHFTTAQGLAHDVILGIGQDRNGNLWFGTRGGGVSKYQTRLNDSVGQGRTFTNFTTEQGLAENNVYSITEDKEGNIWFGTEGGVSRYNGQSFANFTTSQGLADDAIMCALKDKSGNLWFGTVGGGLSRYDGTSFTNFTTAQGLADNMVYDMVQDEQGTLWIGTNLGLTSLKFQTPPAAGAKQETVPAGAVTASSEELKNYAPVWEYYNNRTGYPIKDLNTHAMCMTREGVIWGGCGDDKVIRFDPSAINKGSHSPTVLLQSVKVNEETICWYTLDGKSDSAARTQQEMMSFGKLLSEHERDAISKRFGDIKFDGITRWYPVPENLRLPNTHNNITFDFAAIETGRNVLLRYQYMLEGYDHEWSPVTNKTSASFGNIFEGKYTFKLRARSAAGIWSEPVSYTFRVLPPWWRTWWMYVFYVVSFLSLSGGYIKWRERKLNKTKELLEEKVALRTKELDERNKVVEEKNKEITDSINYAQRIQNAKLPNREDIFAVFPQSFILFKPKYIVSGDFYFLQKRNEAVFIAAADCTGHGVPGGFMSIIGSEKLEDAIEQSADTSAILKQLNQSIKTSLHQTDSDDSTRDGMDIALCSVDTESLVIKFAGANRPLWIIRNGSELEEIKPTKKGIGGLTENDQHFDTHQAQLKKGDTFYIFSDGYADTFGGENGKKLTTKKFKQILFEIQNKTMKEQGQHLDDLIENWKSEIEQIDDILVIGVRV